MYPQLIIFYSNELILQEDIIVGGREFFDRNLKRYFFFTFQSSARLPIQGFPEKDYGEYFPRDCCYAKEE